MVRIEGLLTFEIGEDYRRRGGKNLLLLLANGKEGGGKVIQKLWLRL